MASNIDLTFHVSKSTETLIELWKSSVRYGRCSITNEDETSERSKGEILCDIST